MSTWTNGLRTSQEGEIVERWDNWLKTTKKLNQTLSDLGIQMSATDTTLTLTDNKSESSIHIFRYIPEVVDHLSEPRFILQLIMHNGDKLSTVDNTISTIIHRATMRSPMKFKNCIFSSIEIFVMLRYIVFANNEINMLSTELPRPHGYVNVL